MDVHHVIAAVLVVTLLLAAYFDLRYREIPRWVWLGGFFVAMPLGLYQLAQTFQDDQILAQMNLLIVVFIVGVAWFATEMEWNFNMGDTIGLAVVFISLSYGLYPLTILFFAGLWGLIIVGVTMIRHRSVRVGTIPYLVPLALGVFTTLLLWS